MNELRKHRVALAALGAVVVSAAILYLMYVPSSANQKMRQSEIESLEHEITGLTTFLQTAEIANDLTSTLAEQRSETLNQLYSLDSLESFIDDFGVTLEAWGMSNVRVSPAIDVLLSPTTVELDGSKLARIMFNVQARGTLIDGGQAIEEIENRRYFISMPHLAIEHQDQISPESVWSFQLLAHFRVGDDHDG